MQIIRSGDELAAASAAARAGGRLALVPTMGALHAGHLRLVEEARTRADRVIVSIFVNPLQFNDAGDLQRYPRAEAEDLSKLEEIGCDIVWVPAPEHMYPEGFATTVSVNGVSELWEGEHRPGHFVGVATIVAKLLIAAMPHVAVFGEKDFQQLALIRRMTVDLGLPIEIAGVPTVRDPDGLALSSRNALLTPEERSRALALPKALTEARVAIIRGQPIGGVIARAKDMLVDAGFLKIDYVALVDSVSLEPLERPAGTMRLIAAATIGSTRLIDNLPVLVEHG